MEVELADRLGVRLGDRLTFSGDTQQFSATITSRSRFSALSRLGSAGLPFSSVSLARTIG
jgi:hypothetical protein